MNKRSERSGVRSRAGIWTEIKRNKHCYVWLAPFFILFVFLCLYPACYGFYVSLTNYDGLARMDFVGFSNYVKAFRDPKFYSSLWNTVVLWALIVPARTILALLFAVLLNSKRILGRKVYQSIVLLPYITAVAIVAIVFRIALTTSGCLVNVLLGNLFGIDPIGWLDTTALSKVSVAMMNIWRMTGYFALVMLAGMQKIPQSVHEAAMLDGVGPVRKFFSITVPLMMPEIFFVSLISTIWIFQNVSDVMVLTQGGPINSSTTLVYYLYQNAYEYGKMGYSAALSFILFVLLLAFSGLLAKHYYKDMEG